MSWHGHALQQPPWLRVSDDLGDQCQVACNFGGHASYCKAGTCTYWALVVTLILISKSMTSVVECQIVWPRWSKQVSSSWPRWSSVKWLTSEVKCQVVDLGGQLMSSSMTSVVYRLNARYCDLGGQQWVACGSMP